MAAERPPVVIDVGTGYTKMGYATNTRPDFIIPTVIGNRDMKTTTSARVRGDEDLDFYIGYEALQHGPGGYPNYYIMRHGQIENWDKIEQFWEHCLFKYLRVEPEDHAILLTEPPLNSPDNREYTAEIMFETFNVPFLYIGMQAMLAIAASWTGKGPRSLTGTVVDSGDGVTHIIPVVHGYPISSAIAHVPVAGKEMTEFIAGLLKDREPTVAAEDRFATAKAIKEQFCRVAQVPSAMFAKWDENPGEFVKTYTGVASKTGKPFTCEVGPERFLAPEVFFSPEIVSKDYKVPVPRLLYNAIRLSPVVNRVELFSNIVLSGGSTTFSGLAKRLQKDVQLLVDEGLRSNAEEASKRLGRKVEAGKVPVTVHEHKRQQYAVWYGGAMLASTGEAFISKCHTKAAYDESGPSIARASAIFGESAL